MKIVNRAARAFPLLVLAAALASIPSHAQVLLSGDWTSLRAFEDEQERGPGPDLGDYAGIPINDAARLRAESWDASRRTPKEHQCRVHVVPYIYRGRTNRGAGQDKDPATRH